MKGRDRPARVAALDMKTGLPKRVAGRWKRCSRATALLSLIILMNWAGGNVCGAGEEMARRCVTCHITRSPALEAGEETLYVPSGLEREDGAEEMCYSCHNGSVIDSRKQAWTGHQHPTGMTPSPGVRIPEDFPLTKKNQVFCGTCHSPHVPTFQIDGRTVSNLRVTDKSKDFCIECHTTRNRSAHFTGKASKPAPPIIDISGGIVGTDRKNLTCRTCHLSHGSREKELLVRSKENLCEDCHGENPSRPGIGQGMESHSVRVQVAEKYLQSQWPNKKQIVLGKNSEIVCLTCHSAHGAEDESNLLVVENTIGELCMPCHPERRGDGSKGRNNGNHPLIEQKESGKTSGGGCAACHRAHNGAAARVAERGKKTLLSASMANSELCALCHKDFAAFGIDGARALGTHPLGVEAHIQEAAPSQGQSLPQKENLTCESCHQSHGADPGWSSLRDHRSSSCLPCHPAQNSLDSRLSAPGNHPVYVRPASGSIPAEFISSGGETGEYGELVCRTCHGVHRALEGTPLLIKPVAEKNYCTKCHPAEKLLFGTKHDISASGAESPDKSSHLAAEEESCGTCHGAHGWTADADGSSDVISGICFGCHTKGDTAGSDVGTHGHPIGVGMSDTGNPSKLPLFTAEGRKASSGRVTCSTCHNVHREKLPRVSRGDSMLTEAFEGNFLRMPYLSSNALCISCHADAGFVIGTKHDLYNSRTKVRGGNLPPSLQEGPCSICHSPHKGMGPKMWARETLKNTGQLSDLCLNCHSPGNPAAQKSPLHTHPTNVSLPPDTKSDLPLYDMQGRKTPIGQMTCSTCHSVHGSESASGAQTDPSSAAENFLRKVKTAGASGTLGGGTALCVHCHMEQRSVLGTSHDKGSGICGGCHSPHAGNQAFLWALPLSKADEASVSALCSSCHGSMSQGQDAQKGAYSHPLDVAVAVNNPVALPLYNKQGKKDMQGVITCATCHDVHGENQPTGEQAASSAGKFRRVQGSPEKLCAQCHADKTTISGTTHDLTLKFPRAKNRLGQTAADHGVCSICHTPHLAEEQNALWALEEASAGDDPYSRRCLSCHRENGLAANKAPAYLSHPKTRAPAAQVQQSAKGEEKQKSFGNVLKDIIIGPEEEMFRGPVQYVEMPMKFVDRLSLRRDTPPLLPLYDEKGKPGNSGILTCPSCHDIHDSGAEMRRAIFKEGPERVKLEKSLLRTGFVDEATRLCGDCHGLQRQAFFWDFHKARRGSQTGK